MKLSCIVPAYNEAERIGEVLTAALSAPSIDEIIVVNDCSTDNTQGMVATFPSVKLLNHKFNQGKTQAVKTGVKAAKGEYLLFLDADLIGLDQNAIEALIAPVFSQKADMALSLRKNAPRTWRALGIDYISGERICRRAFFMDQIEAWDQLPKFGLEVFMNDEILAQNLRIAVVPWPQVTSPMKAKKFGFWSGLKRDALMMKDMLKVISPIHMARQVIKMRHARV